VWPIIAQGMGDVKEVFRELVGVEVFKSNWLMLP